MENVKTDNLPIQLSSQLILYVPLLPVVRPDGSVGGVLHHHPGVVTDPVLPPVLVPGVVHPEPAPVPWIGSVLPVMRLLSAWTKSGRF